MSNTTVLFDVNASVGKPCTGGAGFPTVRDRLQAMDRFGIGRALVWNEASAQNHALTSNQALLEEIRATPGAAGRIFPALTVSGLMTYERDGLATLGRQLQALPCRALRFVNGGGRLTLMQLEPVLRSLRRPRPFLILRHEQASAADILAFTEAFPDVPAVLTEVMWRGSSGVLELMRRRKNVLCDTSWQHSFGAIELIVRHFGAERLLFGTGYRSHNGAALAALARAELTATQRRQIARGNLERLTGLGATPAVTPQWTANTLWPRFLAGKSLEVDVVDAHGHLGPSSGYVLEDHDEAAQLTAAQKAMDRIGIRAMMMSGMQALMGSPVEGNAHLEKLLRPHAAQIFGYVVFNPLYAQELVPLLDRYFTGPVFRGFKTLCGYWRVPITDPRFAPMWAYANRHRLPVLSHTWDDAFNSPAMFRDLVKKYPQVPFLLAHAGGGDRGRREAEALAHQHKNVHLEWCGSFCTAIQWEDTLRRVPARQVVFGTDAMMHDFNWELGRLLSLEISDQQLRLILGGNMRRILALRR